MSTTTTSTIRIILVDDHAIVLSGLKTLFQSDPDFTVVECCRDGEQALAAVRSHDADVLVLDMKMPGMTGLDVLRQLSETQTSCRTVLLTAAIGDSEVIEAVRLGAQGLVLKESSPETLLECVRKVHLGQDWFDQETLSRAFGKAMQREAAARETARILTPRESEIVNMVAQGLRNKVIAERLSITEGTVKIHLHNIYEKVKVDGRLELVLWAQAQGLV
jgi:two-component system, NarL family, nitrate/nitrite response regulator NarL